MKVHTLLIISAAALALSGEPPKVADASPVVIDNSAELASLKAELESLRAELAQAKSVSARAPHEPVAAVATTALAASGGGICLAGNCGTRQGIFRGERRPARRVFAKRPRLFGRR